MSITGAQVVAEARKHEGTPFHHQGRLSGVGLDCVGLGVVVARALGVHVTDTTDYPPETDGVALQRALTESCREVRGPRILGDLLQFRRGRDQWHVGILTELGVPGKMIHAMSRTDGTGRVVEEPIPVQWSRRCVGVWRLRGVA